MFTKRLRRDTRNNVLHEQHVPDKREQENPRGLEAKAREATSYKLETKGCRHTMFSWHTMRAPLGQAHVIKKHARKR